MGRLSIDDDDGDLDSPVMGARHGSRPGRGAMGLSGTRLPQPPPRTAESIRSIAGEPLNSWRYDVVGTATDNNAVSKRENPLAHQAISAPIT
jgi:hypothetical protein